MNSSPRYAAIADLYFDVISPFSYLMDATLRQQGLPMQVRLRPVLFAGLLQAHGTKGPAEVEAKRAFTYEYCTWFAHKNGIPFVMPSVHPFNPLHYLRLIVATGCSPSITSRIFDALWTTGADPEDPAVWRKVVESVGVYDAEFRIQLQTVKSEVRSNTEKAIAEGVFGVPTIVAAGHLFWGLDSLAMLRDYLAGDAVFQSPAMKAARNSKIGSIRKEK